MIVTILYLAYAIMVVAGIGVGLYFAWRNRRKTNGCTGDCNQGRNCTCVPTDKGNKDVQ